MAAEPAPALDMDKTFAFAFKMIGDVTASMLGPLTVIGDRLKLFDKLAADGPATTDEFATRAGITERYAREWLSAMSCHGYVSYDDADKRFGLPPEHAFCLVDRDSPVCLTGLFSMVPSYWANIDTLADAFRHGGGVPQARFGDDFWCGFERFTRTGFRINFA